MRDVLLFSKEKKPGGYRLGASIGGMLHSSMHPIIITVISYLVLVLKLTKPLQSEPSRSPSKPERPQNNA
jgi:hypothetical protein